MERKPSLDRKYVVKPVVGAFAVLEALVHGGKPMSLAALAESTGISKTTTFRYLKTLGCLGYVVATGDSLFEIGPATWKLGGTIGGQRTLRALANEELKALSTQFGETVNLAIPSGKRLHYIAILEPDRPLHFDAEVGDSECFHCTALGKALLAFMSPADVDLHLGTTLRRFTKHTIISRNQLQRALASVRRLGYAVDREENELGCVCYAAPILGDDNLPMGALSISIPITRLTDKLDLAAAEAVKDAASRVSKKAQRHHAMPVVLANFRSARGRMHKDHRAIGRVAQPA